MVNGLKYIENIDKIGDFMVKISDRVSKILPSGTLAMTQKAGELKSSGKKDY